MRVIESVTGGLRAAGQHALCSGQHRSAPGKPAGRIAAVELAVQARGNAPGGLTVVAPSYVFTIGSGPDGVLPGRNSIATGREVAVS